MNEKQQIEEMANYIDRSHWKIEQDSRGCNLNSREIAEFLYNTSYRKQSEGEWRSELVKRCDWKGKKHDYYQPNSCSLCHEAVLKRTPFCPNCGAKMKGGE